MLDSLTTFGQLLLVVIGFGSVIFVHEMGHFLAAKWAGIRVHEFAIGFGKPICAWRKGVGFRIGSTRPNFDPSKPIHDDKGETEYRLNWLPFGGYVKMLGQDDLNPTESSDPNSYTQKPVWKRMVVVSAGVVMNLILAAVLFLIVFMIGLPAPSPTIGFVRPDSPAALATPVNNATIEPGLRPGDRVIEIHGRRAMSFADISLAAAMARKGETLPIIVKRDGVETPIEFSLTPKHSKATNLLEIGVGSASSVELETPPDDPMQRILYDTQRKDAGLAEAPEGSRLVRVNGAPVQLAGALFEAFANSDGSPVTAEFAAPDGSIFTTTLSPEPDLQIATTTDAQGEKRSFQHLLGLRPAAIVGACSKHALSQGLKPGDALARVGDVVWPNIENATKIISARGGENVSIRVLRGSKYVELNVAVQRDGRIGMYFEAAPSKLPSIIVRAPKSEKPLADSTPDLTPGARILRVGDQDVANFAQLRRALTSAGEGDVELLVRLPIGPDPVAAPTQTITWTISADDHAAIADLGWSSPISPGLFKLDTITLKASGPIDAIVMGVSETHRYVMMTYMTFVRLVQGSVKVEHIKGPVGIAHFGTKVVEQGFLNLLFFLAVISANLAVINFLPLPIVDGGLFIFLLVEGITRKPVSIVIQNVATLAGILLVGSVFLLVTFNDIRTLLGS